MLMILFKLVDTWQQNRAQVRAAETRFIEAHKAYVHRKRHMLKTNYNDQVREFMPREK